MASQTQAQFEQSIISQLQITDPQLSTTLGTPTRKIITAVASQLASLVVDETTTTTLWSVDSYSGDELDSFAAMFGFARQQAQSASGTISVTRDNADSVQAIAYGSQFYKPATATQAGVYFQTTSYQEMAKGVTKVELPVVATVAGSAANVAANTVTYSVSYTGYFAVTNELPMTGGRDLETDAEFRTRIVNTIFRGEFGTVDQYLGLALAHAADSRASVIGQESTWTETVAVDTNYTAWASTDEASELLDIANRFWVRNADTDKLYSRGEYNVEETVMIGGDGTSTPAVTITFHDVAETELIGPVMRGNSYELSQSNVLRVTGLTSNDGVTPITTGYTVSGNRITITSAFPGDYVGQTVLVSYVYKAASIGDFITVEYDYLSNLNRGGIKTVEVFVDGESGQTVADLQFIDFNKLITAQNRSNWRHDDGTLPTVNNLYIPLSYQPVERSFNGMINVGADIILQEGKQFRMLYDSGYANRDGSSRAMDAIELMGTYSGDKNSFVPAGTNISLTNETPLNVPFVYNVVPGEVQKLVDKQSVVTANTLVHEVRRRRYGVHLTLMFSVYTRDAIMASVEKAVIDWANSLPFGQTIQFSDIETVAANVAGVDNVRIATKEDAAGKVAQGSGTLGAYGIVEYERDGKTQKKQYTSDFRQRGNECFYVQYVQFYSRTQQGW